MGTSLGTREEKAVVMSDHLKTLPKWFLIVIVAAGIALIPFWHGQTQRTVDVDNRLETLESMKTEEKIDEIDNRLSRVEYQMAQQKKTRERFIKVLDKMDENLGSLSEAVVELRVEIKNLKNKE
jgi:septal ring factor EnvC (AmiA/AmiB activator)